VGFTDQTSVDSVQINDLDSDHLWGLPTMPVIFPFPCVGFTDLLNPGRMPTSASGTYSSDEYRPIVLVYLRGIYRPLQLREFRVRVASASSFPDPPDSARDLPTRQWALPTERFDLDTGNQQLTKSYPVGFTDLTNRRIK
jgi:hypothetical protein